MADDLLVKVRQIYHAVVIILHQTLDAKLRGGQLACSDACAAS